MKQRSGGIVWWVGWRACAALGIGAVASVVVAYVGAVNDSDLDFGGYGDGNLWMLRQTNRWWDVVTFVGEGSGPEALARVRSVRVWSEESNELAVLGAAGSQGSRDVVQIGWPARCVWGVSAASVGEGSEGLEPVPEWVERFRYVKFPLPRRVLWSGLMVDAAVFGAPVLVAACVPAVVRRMRRRAKGLCQSCGYDLRATTEGGGICPECGKNGQTRR